MSASKPSLAGDGGMGNIDGLRVRKIAVVAIDDVYPGSLTGVIDVLQIANAHLRRRVQQVLPGSSPKRSTLALTILSPEGVTVTSLGGIQINAQANIRSCREHFEAVILPAIPFGSASAFTKKLGTLSELFPWLRAQREQGAVFAANSTGILLLAESGILDDHTATISINLEHEFRRRYPLVKLDRTCPIVEDRDTICAASIGSNLQMIWRVVERLRSGVIARQTARDLFFHELEASQASMQFDADEIGNPLIERARYWLIHNISSKLQLAELARMLSISERTLFRRFKRVTGVTPNTYLQNVRIESAKSHLTLTDDSIEKIAASVGYGDKAFFSRVFRKHTGLTPRAYRSMSRQRQFAGSTEMWQFSLG